MIRFKHFKNAILSQIDNGIDRYSAVTAFNEGFFKLRKTEPTLLSDVAYVPRKITLNDGVEEVRHFNKLAKSVIQYISRKRWNNVYGLSYIDTMRLTYAEWSVMQQQLDELEQPEETE